MIIGTALNQDGHTNGISLPSPEAQARLVRDACADAGIDPSQVGFVEAHGTGTAVGDPIEATRACRGALRRPPGEAPLPIGSVKTNLGHLGNRGGRCRSGQGAAGAQARADSGQPAFRNAQSEHRFCRAETPRADGAGAVSRRRRARALWASTRLDLAEPTLMSFSRRRRRAPQPEHPGAHPNRGWPLVLSARSEEALLARRRRG